MREVQDHGQIVALSALSPHSLSDVVVSRPALPILDAFCKCQCLAMVDELIVSQTMEDFTAKKVCILVKDTHHVQIVL